MSDAEASNEVATRISFRILLLCSSNENNWYYTIVNARHKQYQHIGAQLHQHHTHTIKVNREAKLKQGSMIPFSDGHD